MVVMITNASPYTGLAWDPPTRKSPPEAKQGALRIFPTARGDTASVVRLTNRC